jgi:hypothetical protein
MKSNSPSASTTNSKNRPSFTTAAAPKSSQSAKQASATRPPGRPPKEVVPDHLQSTIGDGFRVVAKRNISSTLNLPDGSPSSSPPTKVPNTQHELPQPPEHIEEVEDNGEDNSLLSTESPEADVTYHTLLQRLNAMEVYIATQDQRILNLEAELKELKKTPHKHSTATDQSSWICRHS